MKRPSSRSGFARLLALAWVALLLVGLVGVYQRLTQGHLPAGYGSFVPWGLWVALYFHGVGIAGGAFAIGALGYLLGWPGFGNKKVLRLTIVLSVACILPAFLGVLLDLGHMERATRIFTSPSFTSMMAFNAWMYSGYLVIAGLIWWLSFRPDRGWLKPLICMAALFSVMFPSQSGAFFGVVDAKPYWHSALLPMMFLTSAIAAGSATLLVIRTLQPGLPDNEAAIRRLRSIVMAAVGIYFVFEFAEFSIVLWNPTAHAPALGLVLFGPYWWVFWIVHLFLGGLVVLALLASRSTKAWTVAALLAAVCFVSARLNVLVPGQAVSEIRGLQDAFQHPRLTFIYNATAMEYFVGCFMLAVGIALFVIGDRISNARAGKSAPAAGDVS
jgi:molybdopterin-containing oxidoreductase family membrane subunit